MIKYLYFEDTGAGAEFWGLVNEYILDNSFIAEGKRGIRNIYKAFL